MYPRGLFGVLLSVDQHAPDWLTSSSSMHWEALTGAPGPLVYLKHEFNHPQNTWPFRLCTDMFRMILYSKVKAKGGGMCSLFLYWLATAKWFVNYVISVQQVRQYTCGHTLGDI